MTKVNVDALKFAKFFASVKHAGQTYSFGMPYTHHLSAVEEVIWRFYPMADPVLPVAAWLHDVVEDTGTKLKDIVEMFGQEVADLVAAVTNEPGENRKIRHALTYPKTRAGGELAVRLKLADRIANVEAGGKLVQMYKKEYEDFKRALYTPGENEEMWAYLDTLLKGANV